MTSALAVSATNTSWSFAMAVSSRPPTTPAASKASTVALVIQPAAPSAITWITLWVTVPHRERTSPGWKTNRPRSRAKFAARRAARCSISRNRTRCALLSAPCRHETDRVVAALRAPAVRRARRGVPRATNAPPQVLLCTRTTACWRSRARHLPPTPRLCCARAESSRSALLAPCLPLQMEAAPSRIAHLETDMALGRAAWAPADGKQNVIAAVPYSRYIPSTAAPAPTL